MYHHVEAPSELTAHQLRGLLRRGRLPARLGGDAWVRARYGGDPERAARLFMTQVARLVGRLEGATRGARPHSLGALLRMRYLEGASANAVRRALFVSESHYHRLHGLGLRWLAEQLNGGGEGWKDEG